MLGRLLQDIRPAKILNNARAPLSCNKRPHTQYLLLHQPLLVVVGDIYTATTSRNYILTSTKGVTAYMVLLLFLNIWKSNALLPDYNDIEQLLKF